MRLQGVHGPHDALDHRLQDWPMGVLGFEVLGDRVGDDGVFELAVKQRLVGDLLDGRDDEVAGRGQVTQDREFILRCLAVRRAKHGQLIMTATADDQHCVVAGCKFARARDRQDVLPFRSLEGLRGEAETGKADVPVLPGWPGFPLVARVWGVDERGEAGSPHARIEESDESHEDR